MTKDDVAGVPNGLILFDGICVLCSRSVRFVLENDTDAWFCFTPIQSPYGRALATRLGVDAEKPGTSAVIVRGRAFFKSDAAIEVLRRLPRFSWAPALSLLPRRLRDLIYDWVAQNRYRLFGRTERCLAPSPDFTDRFLFDNPSQQLKLAHDRPSPFQILLGADFNRLPTVIQRVHARAYSLHTSGRAEVSTASGMLARCLSWLANLPHSGSEVPVTVSFHPDGLAREFWQRQFGNRRYASTMLVGGTHASGLLVEQFGLFNLHFQLTPRADELAWSLTGWRFCGVPLPRWSRPRIECRECTDGQRFMFDIDVTFPLIGHLTHYRGWLMPPRSGVC